MQRRNFLRAGLLMGVVLLLPSLMRCQCDPPDHCTVATDCYGNVWMNSECTEDEGYWACVSNSCSSRCGEVVCDDNTDCMVITWPTDEVGCQPADGVWECRESKCVAVCDDGECAQDAECDGKTWPDDAGCAEDKGHWECQVSSCVPVCDSPECKVAEDCASNTWPEIGCTEEDGHWECQGGDCTAVCDEQQCTQDADCSGEVWPADAGCEQAQGHWKCQDGACVAMCDSECSASDDCTGNTWPAEGVDCEQAHGHWECQDGSCVAVCNTQCDNPLGCAPFEWGEDCSGHWDCVQGVCNEVCDDVGCGDGDCNDAAGETQSSCPDDCGITCSLAMDCTGSEWILPCDGRWECVDSACVGVCDYTTCGDGTCDNNNGESRGSCPEDCMTNCQLPIDCIHNTWTQICQGVWSCYMGDCKQVCESNSCGNGVCSADMGESSTSCYADCHAGACETVGDCIGLPWSVYCEGQWTCDGASGSCVENCTDTDCGDASCDILGGEDPAACATDCADYTCSMDSDCADLTLPDTCTSWMCIRQVCVPVCD